MTEPVPLFRGPDIHDFPVGISPQSGRIGAMNPRFSEDPQSSHRPWPRRYLIFGPLFAVLHIILFFALFVLGIGISDAAPTPGNKRTVHALDVILMAMNYPLHFI